MIVVFVVIVVERDDLFSRRDATTRRRAARTTTVYLLLHCPDRTTCDGCETGRRPPRCTAYTYAAEAALPS